MINLEKLKLFFSEKKRKEDARQNSLSYGFEISDNITIGKNRVFTNLIVRAIIVYLCIIGSIDSYMSAFNLPYDMLKIMLILLGVTFFLILLQYNNITRLIGYTIFVYCLSVYMEKNISVVRSGIVAIINMSYELIRLKFDLPTVSGFHETIADRSLTVTSAIVFISCFYTIIYWEVAGRSMNLILTAILTFFSLSLGLYFDGVPSMLSVLSFGTIWLFVGIVKFHSKTEISTKRAPYRHMVFRRNHYIHKYSDGKTMLQTLIFSFIFIIIATNAIQPVFNKKVFEKTVMPSELKDSSDRMLKNMMIIGFSQLKGYKITGRISNGQLGYYGNVQPDFLPDFNIEYLPINYDTIYLKSFMGSVYENSQWTQIPEESSYKDKEAMDMTAEYFHNHSNEYPALNMSIKNMGVVTERPLLPYFTRLEDAEPDGEYISDDQFKGKFPIGGDLKLQYYPYYDNETIDKLRGKIDVPSDYSDYVYNNYLQIPEENYELISRLCKERGWKKEDPQLVEKLQKFFQDEYTYSLDPGLVPWKTDFVNYFLFENKEGLCAHFASAGTLIFRTLGIPARYVEGYALPILAIDENGEPVEDPDITQFYGGDPTKLRMPPYKVTLSDYNAHGWIEIYKDGFGWVPVELTPISFDKSEVEESDNDRQWMEFFTNFVSSLQSGGQNNAPLIPQETVDNISEKLPYVGYTIGGIIVAIYVFAISLKHIKRRIYFKGKDRNKAFISEYSHLAAIMEYLGITDKNPSHKEIFAVIGENPHLAEKILYSGKTIDENTQNELTERIHQAKKDIIKKQKPLKKLQLYIKV